MIELQIDLPSENRILARLNALPDELQQRLLPALSRISAEMLSRVQASEPVRTGALRDATRNYIQSASGRFVRGKVSVFPEPGQEGGHNLKAAALEYGAHGMAAVRAHDMTLDHVYEHAISPEQVMVAAYNRDVNIAAQRFLRDSLADFQAEFELEIERAIAELARE